MSRTLSRRDWLGFVTTLFIFGVCGGYVMRWIMTRPPQAREIAELFPEFHITGASLEGLSSERGDGMYKFRYRNLHSRELLPELLAKARSSGWTVPANADHPSVTLLHLSRPDRTASQQATVAVSDSTLEIDIIVEAH
ncbi:MAG TPA: hypothetical protein VF669_08305 [Tepidisphaeraceae bacterium]|jgi:hypothetical protein